MLHAAECVSVWAEGSLVNIELCDGKSVYALSWNALGDEYSNILKLIFSEEIKKSAHGVKNLMGQLLTEKLSLSAYHSAIWVMSFRAPRLCSH